MNNYMKLAGVTTFLLLVFGICLGQEKESKEYHINNRTLSEYYYQRIPSEALYNEEPLGRSGLHQLPWVVNTKQPFKSDLTNIIDSIYPSDIGAWLDTAWALMQMKTGIVPDNRIRPLSGALLKYWENPEKYGKLEPFIYRECGDSIANYLRVARTVPSMKQQMQIRPELLKLILLMDDFLQILLELAERTKEAVMPGYTHIRHAQPTTFGHYVLSVYDPIWRCIKILEHGYYAMSKNELGCGALAGTSLPVDRDLVSRYLACDGLIENTNDAVSHTDEYVILVAGLSNISAILSRMGSELNYWSTREYDFIEFEIGAGSFMMPNKRSNQSYFCTTYENSAKLVGLLTEVATNGIRIPHGDMNALGYGMAPPVVQAINLINNTVNQLLYHFPSMTLNEDVMLAAAREGGSASTELANEIFRKFSIDSRTAHHIVKAFIDNTRKQQGGSQINFNEVKIETFQAAAKQVIGYELDLSQAELTKLLDPVHFVEVTNSKGGVAPSEVSRMIADRWKQLDTARKRHFAMVKNEENAQQIMMDDLKKLFNSAQKK
jgi:argininosuccinate lyase